MSGTTYARPILTPEELYRLQQVREENARRERERQARIEAERRARIEAARQRVSKQMMDETARLYQAANPDFLGMPSNVIKTEMARATSESKRADVAARQKELEQARANNLQRAMKELEQAHQQFANQQQMSLARDAWGLLDDVKALSIETQMWFAAGAPGNNAQSGDLAAEIGTIKDVIKNQPERGLAQAKDLLARMRRQRDDVADAHFRRWSDLLVDCSFERGRIQALQERLNESGIDSTETRAAKLVAQLYAAGQALDAVANQEQQYTLNLDVIANAVEDAKNQFDDLSEETFDLVALHQQQKNAEIIAKSLEALGYRGDILAGTPPQVTRNGNRLDVIAVRQSPDTQEMDQKLVAFFVDEDGGIDCDFSGFADRECEIAAEDVFAEFRRRGLVLINQDAAIRLRDMDLSKIDPLDYTSPEFAPKLDHSKRQPELRRRIFNALRRMGFADAEIHEKVMGGTIVIDAMHGNLGYHIMLTPDSEQDVVPEAVDSEVARDGEQDVAPDTVNSEVARVDGNNVQQQGHKWQPPIQKTTSSWRKREQQSRASTGR